MARIPRLVNNGDPTVYHVMSRTALPDFPMGDIENDFLFGLIKKLSRLYLTDILGICLMGNHFHILLRVYPDDRFSDDEIKQRLVDYYGDKKAIVPGQLPFYRKKLSSLSEFMKDVKQQFSRFYNKRHQRRGFFWGDRFKSLIVENGDTLINCLAYIDLNPVRAGIVKKPEAYRWSSLGYHVQTGNKDNFLSMDFGLYGQENMNDQEKLSRYRAFVYGKGTQAKNGKQSIDKKKAEKAENRDFTVSNTDIFLMRTRYFSDSGVIGSKRFVQDHYQRFKNAFHCRRGKIPRKIGGLNGIYSLKRLSDL